MEEILSDSLYKIRCIIFFNSSNSITYILLNNSNIFMAQCLLRRVAVNTFTCPCGVCVAI